MLALKTLSDTLPGLLSCGTQKVCSALVKHTKEILNMFRRHEANHNVDPAFQCAIEGCRKPFQRSDLLIRHMERQSVSSGNRSLAATDRQRHGAAPGMPLDQMSSRSSLSAGTPSLPSAHAFQAMGLEYAPYLNPRFSQPTVTPLPLSSTVSPFTTNPEFPSPHQEQFPDLSNSRSAQRLRQSAGSQSLPPELMYDLSASGSYASSDSCYSPFSDALTSPAISMSGSHTYSPAYSNLRSHTASATPETTAEFHDFPLQYGGNPVTGRMNDESEGLSTYGSLDAAAALYGASTGALASPAMNDTVSSFSSERSVKAESEIREAQADISRAILHRFPFGSNSHLARR